MFRHGETDWNVERRFQGSTPFVPLNEKGIRQAQEAALVLKNRCVNIIYSSSLLRARQTAEIIASVCSVGIVYEENLKERWFGKLEGMTREDVDLQYPKASELMSNGPDWDFASRGMAYLGIEGLSEIRKRSLYAMTKIANEMTCERVAISTHGGFIYNFLSQLESGIPIAKPINNGGIFVLAYKNDEGFKVMEQLS
jgi:broad specificity phosphatase PhoE